MKKLTIFLLITFAVINPVFARAEKKQEKESPIVTKAKLSVAEKMKDPESTKFRNVFSIDGVNVCGEMNAKNSYGGYVGYTRFVVTKELVRIEEEKDEQYKSFEFHFWDNFCLKK